MTQQYRPEIDGLRAIAVTAVLVYHAEFTLRGVQVLPGGFLGVDIFFVISGYLISLILLRDLATGAFSFRRFYERRARRILPAFLVVLATTLPFAWLVLAPKAMQEYAGSLLSSLAFGSNIWFWREDSYAAEASLLKPLLHTWSLSMEEQFYIFIPVLLLLLWRWRRRWLIPALAGLFLASLVLADIVSRSSPDTAFFLLPMRAWELLAGGLLATFEKRFGRPGAGRPGAALAGSALVGLIIALMVFADSMPHPSVLTLLPVGATAAYLWFVQPNTLAGAYLSTAPMRYLGKTSYSLYLWHMPVFAFARNLNLASDGLTKLLLVALCVVLADLSNRLVEAPMRWKASPRLFWSFVGLLTAIALVAGGFALATSGVAGRPLAEQATGALPQLDGSDIDNPSAHAIVLNLGDSHSSALSGALHEAALLHGFALRSINSSGIMPIEHLTYLADNKFDERYGPDNVLFLTSMIREAIDAEVAKGRQVYVTLTGRLPLYLSNAHPVHPLTGKAEAGATHAFSSDGASLASAETVTILMRETVAAWQAAGATVVLVYPVPEMVYDIPAEAFRAAQASPSPDGEAFDGNALTSIPMVAVRERQAQAYQVLDAVGDAAAIRIHPRDVLCTDAVCEGVRDGQLMYRDDDHVSAYGARLIIAEILRATGLVTP